MIDKKIWWYSANNAKFGPYTTAELKLLAKSGQITSDSMVWKAGIKNWIPATSVNGLLTYSLEDEPPPLPDQCATNQSQSQLSDSSQTKLKSNSNSNDTNQYKDNIAESFTLTFIKVFALVVTGVIVIGIFIAFNDSTVTHNNTSYSDSTNNSIAQQNSTSYSTSTNNSIAQQKYYSIGEKILLNGLEISIESILKGTIIGNNNYTSKASDGAIYVAIKFNYKNTSNNPINPFQVPQIYLLSNNQTKYSNNLDASIMYAASINSNKQALSYINPGVSILEGQIFEVSEELFDPHTWVILIEFENSKTKVALT